MGEAGAAAAADELLGIPFTAAKDQGEGNTSEVGESRGSDYALARRAAGGDMDSFEQLYQRHVNRVYSVCLRMTGNQAEAEDLVQDVFIHLFRKIGTFRGESAFSTWLHRMAVNLVLMHFRRRRSRPETMSEEGVAPIEIEQGTENPHRMPIIDRIALEEAVAQLPAGYRAVFILHDVEGHGHDEIARRLGIAEGTSKSQLHKARLKLRKLICLRATRA